MKTRPLVLTWCAVLISCPLFLAPASAQQERRTGTVAAGASVGLQGDTADDTAFAAGLNLDYFLTDNISVGPLLQTGVTDDLWQIGVSAQLKYTLDLLSNPELKPQLQGGIGFIYADLDRGSSGDEDDISFLIPIGFGAEYRLTEDISLESNLLFNFTDLDAVRNENFFFTWLTGLRFHFR